MRYEIHFGDFTHWCKAGSPLQAGMLTLQACIEQRKTFPRLPMQVIHLETGEETIVGLATVLNVQQLSAEYNPELPEPPLDPDCPILQHAKQTLVA